MKASAHLAAHPFGQIPTYEEDGLVLFETGAIVLHIAERHGGALLPTEPNARVRAIAWMFAALNTVETPILELVTTRFLEGDKPGPNSACRLSKTASAPGFSSSPHVWATSPGSMALSARATF